MARPHYETKEQQEERHAIMMALVSLAGVTHVHDASPANYEVQTADRRVAQVEGKTSTYSMEQLDRMGGIFLSHAKWQRICTYCQYRDRAFWIVVRASGKLWRYIVPSFEGDQHYGLKLGGRTDRNDPRDMEDVVMFKRARFECLSSPAAPVFQTARQRGFF